MSDRKKRILMVNEASFLHTGYSTYGYEVLKRLYKTGKFEIAELACYAKPNDSRMSKVPWKVYGNLPDPANQAEVDYYYSNDLHQFGSWKFEEVCLSFKPDIVFAIRDWVMDEFFERSPFRRYFHLSLMPTVDSIPQNPQWLSTYMNADAVFTYSDWALNVLNSCNGMIKTVGTASPGADIQTFRPIENKVQHKAKFGLPADSIVIGSLMRNQIRKLFPDLLKSFRMFLDQSPSAISERSYLYLHTSYPDYWDFPKLLVEHEVGHKCIFTYKCQACNNTFISHFRDARASCIHCGKPEAFIPNTHIGLDRKQLSDIYNLFDVYVQYSLCEGWGMSIVEAAACGLHPIVVDYSGMEDFKKTLKATPLKILQMTREGDNNTDKAIPDNQDLVNQLIKFLELPDGWKAKKGRDARNGAEKFYDWDKTAKIWEQHFDSVKVKKEHEGWLSPLKQHTSMLEPPDGLSPEEFVEWAILNVSGRSEFCNHFIALRLLRDIQWQSTTQNTGNQYFNEMSAAGTRPKRKNFSREDAISELKGIADYYNYWEKKRNDSLTKKEI